MALLRLALLLICAFGLTARAALAGEPCSMSHAAMTETHVAPAPPSEHCHDAKPKPQTHDNHSFAACTCAAMTALADLPQQATLSAPVYAIAWHAPEPSDFRSTEVAPGDRPPAA